MLKITCKLENHQVTPTKHHEVGPQPSFCTCFFFRCLIRRSFSEPAVWLTRPSKRARPSGSGKTARSGRSVGMQSCNLRIFELWRALSLGLVPKNKIKEKQGEGGRGVLEAGRLLSCKSPSAEDAEVCSCFGWVYLGVYVSPLRSYRSQKKLHKHFLGRHVWQKHVKTIQQPYSTIFRATRKGSKPSFTANITNHGSKEPLSTWPRDKTLVLTLSSNRIQVPSKTVQHRCQTVALRQREGAQRIKSRSVLESLHDCDGLKPQIYTAKTKRQT